MKNIKLFEEFFDDLIYGKDGTDFKCGDRVIGKSLHSVFDGKEGEIVDVNKFDNQYLVCFDEPIGKAYSDAVDAAARHLGIEPFRIEVDKNYAKKIKKIKNKKVDPYGEEDWGWVDTNKKNGIYNIPKGHGLWIEKQYLRKI